MPHLPSKEFKIKQLQQLIKLYPDTAYLLDIEGLVLDYIGCSGASIIDVFELNSKTYFDLFTGRNEGAGSHLLNSVVDTQEMRDELSEQCKEKYPKVAAIIEEQKAMGKESATFMSELIEEPSRTLGYPIDMVIWQISDIHFGRFNKFEPDPRQLAFTLAKLATDHRNVRPDIIIVSGDVSSIAANKEFADFKIFCSELSDALWGGCRPEKILVIPGNHDVSWKDDGTSDHMSAFAASFSDDKVCITPFGDEKAEFDGGRITVTRFNRKPATAPPFAVVKNKDKEIEFILFVSGYFSGEIPAQVRDALKGLEDPEKDLINVLRNDEGAVNQEYLFHISASLDRREATALGVIHHNPVQYGIEVCQNRFAPQLLETLWNKRVPILLHGHIHQTESKGTQRPFTNGLSYPVPATTLCSIPTGGSGRGINIHLVGPSSGDRKIDTLVWNISDSLAFKQADAVLRYRFSVKTDHLNIEHG